eukprot:765516-Hanusia_phi.AAC.2
MLNKDILASSNHIWFKSFKHSATITKDTCRVSAAALGQFLCKTIAYEVSSLQDKLSELVGNAQNMKESS